MRGSHPWAGVPCPRTHCEAPEWSAREAIHGEVPHFWPLVGFQLKSFTGRCPRQGGHGSGHGRKSCAPCRSLTKRAHRNQEGKPLPLTVSLWDSPLARLDTTRAGKGALLIGSGSTFAELVLKGEFGAMSQQSDNWHHEYAKRVELGLSIFSCQAGSPGFS